jgi:hypothetical protein
MQPLGCDPSAYLFVPKALQTVAFDTFRVLVSFYGRIISITSLVLNQGA